MDREGTGFICAGHQTKGIIVRFSLTSKIPTVDKLDAEVSYAFPKLLIFCMIVYCN